MAVILLSMVGCSWLFDVPENHVPQRAQVDNLRANQVPTHAPVEAFAPAGGKALPAGDAAPPPESRDLRVVRPPVAPALDKPFQFKSASGEILKPRHRDVFANTDGDEYNPEVDRPRPGEERL